MLINKYKYTKINNINDIGSIMLEIYKKRPKLEQHKEYKYIVGLDDSNYIKYIDLVAIGSSFSVTYSDREIFRLALLKNIFSIISVHNHPNNICDFSEVDNENAKDLKELCKKLEINLLDYIIVTDYNFKGLYDENYNPQVIGYGSC